MKPVLLFGMPRAGTTPVSFFIGEYLRQTQGVQRLGEFFHIYASSYEKSGEQITRYKYPKQVGRKIYCEWIEEVVIRKRIALLEGNLDKYFFKVLSSQLTNDLLNWLEENYEWIFIERKDQREHLLSFAISMLTGVWYVPSGRIELEEKSLSMRRGIVDQFTNLYFNYFVVKSRIKPKRILYYEDFEKEMTPSAVLGALGWDHRAAQWENVYPTMKQNEGDKMRYFSNPDEIEKLIEELKYVSYLKS